MLDDELKTFLVHSSFNKYSSKSFDTDKSLSNSKLLFVINFIHTGVQTGGHETSSFVLTSNQKLVSSNNLLSTSSSIKKLFLSLFSSLYLLLNNSIAISALLSSIFRAKIFISGISLRLLCIKSI